MTAISVVVNADTGKFVANLDGVEKSVAKAANAVAAAKNKIVESFIQQAEAAKKAGASTEELERIQRKAAQSLTNVTESNATRIIASLDRISDKNRKVAAEIQALNALYKLPSGESHRTEITDRMATSGVVRVADGNGGIRATENFIASIPGAGKAMQMLFPIVGAAGLAGMLFDLGEKGYEAFQKVQHAAQATRAAFEDLHTKSQVQVADKELENQKIQDQIDKISGHPNNGLATALLEANKMAIQLRESLQDDRKQLEALFKDNDLGMFGKAMSMLGFGPKATGQQETEITGDYKDLQRQLIKAQNIYNQAFKAASDDAGREAATHSYNEAIHKTFQSKIDAYKREDARLAKEEADSRTRHNLAMAAGPQGAGLNGNIIDDSKKRENIQGALDMLENRQQIETLDESIYAGTKKLGQLKQDKDGAESGDKEAAKRLKAMEAQAAELERNGATPKAIYDFWDRNRRAFADGSDQFNTILEKQASIAKAGAEKVARAFAEARAGNLQGAMDIAVGHKEPKEDEGAAASAEGALAMQKYVAKGTDEAADQQAQLQAMAAMSRAKMEEIRLNEEAGRSITRLDALRQIAALHQQGYAAELARLDEKRAQAQKAPYLSEEERAKQLAAIDAQRATVKAQAEETQQRDNYNLQAPDSTAWTGAKDALNEFADAARDNAAMMRDLVKASMADINRTILADITGQGKRGEWKDVGRNIATNGAGKALDKAEGSLLSGMGFGKPDGSESKPWFVKVLGGNASKSGSGAAKGGSDLLGGLASSMGSLDNSGGSDGGDGTSDGSPAQPSGGRKALGGFLRLAGNLLGMFAGGKALGGGVDQPGFYDVGEMGRERIFLPAGSYVQPSHKMKDLGGDTHLHIDARGAHDPAQTEAAIHRALGRYTPHLVAASVAAVHETNLRQPSGSRR